MKEHEITQIIVRYVAKFRTPFKNGLWLVIDKSVSDKEYNVALVQGHSIDIISECIDSGHLFGWYIPHSVDEADNRDNTEFKLLMPGELISMGCEAKVGPDGLTLLAPTIIKPDESLKLRWTKLTFIDAATLLGIKDAKQIADEIYP